MPAHGPTDLLREERGYRSPRCPVLARIAVDTGFSAETLYMVAKGHKRPSAMMAPRIAGATRDEVAREGLRPDVFGTEPSTVEREGG